MGATTAAAAGSSATSTKENTPPSDGASFPTSPSSPSKHYDAESRNVVDGDDQEGNEGDKAKKTIGQDDDDNNNNEEDDADDDEPPPKRKLYKSQRFKGYLTLLLSSVINYQAVSVSDVATDLNTVPSSQTQQNYGLSVSLISCLLSGACIAVHLDNFSCFKNLWRDQLFAPKSRFETLLDTFLVVWWGIATIIQTSVRGIAGDGKNQYNVYYSTWVCFWATGWTMESKMTEYGWPTLKVFVKSWPFRSPGWIAIFVSDFFCLFWYVDLYINTQINPQRLSESQQIFYGNIAKSQYQWLIFVAAASLLPAGAFVFVEIFRTSDSNDKPRAESYLEGFALLILTCAWVPSVIVATTPGGFAAVVGNAYVFSWTTTLFVLETSIWFIRDSRSSVHQTLEQKGEEYRKHQSQVLENTRKLQEEAEAKRRVESPREEWTMFRRNTIGSDSVVDGGQRSPQESRPLPKADTIVDTDETTGVRFEMKDVSDHDEHVDDEIRQERQMMEADRSAYFDTLDDILE